MQDNGHSCHTYKYATFYCELIRTKCIEDIIRNVSSCVYVSRAYFLSLMSSVTRIDDGLHCFLA